MAGCPAAGGPPARRQQVGGAAADAAAPVADCATGRSFMKPAPSAKPCLLAPNPFAPPRVQHVTITCLDTDGIDRLHTNDTDVFIALRPMALITKQAQIHALTADQRRVSFWLERRVNPETCIDDDLTSPYAPIHSACPSLCLAWQRAPYTHRLPASACICCHATPISPINVRLSITC